MNGQATIDDQDMACYIVRRTGAVEHKRSGGLRGSQSEPQIQVFPVTSEQLAELPEWVTDSINVGHVASYDGALYGPSEESFNEPSRCGEHDE